MQGQAFYTPGRLCELFKIDYRCLMRIIADKGIEPSFYIDDLAHFDAQAKLRIEDASTKWPYCNRAPAPEGGAQ